MTKCPVISEAAVNLWSRCHSRTPKFILSIQKLVIVAIHAFVCLCFISVTSSCHRTPLCSIQMSKVANERRQCFAILDYWVGVEMVRGWGQGSLGRNTSVDAV